LFYALKYFEFPQCRRWIILPGICCELMLYFKKDSVTRFSTLSFFVNATPCTAPWLTGKNCFSFFVFAELFGAKVPKIISAGSMSVNLGPGKKPRGLKISWHCPFKQKILNNYFLIWIPLSHIFNVLCSIQKSWS
jgi:hypothetical protein